MQHAHALLPDALLERGEPKPSSHAAQWGPWPERAGGGSRGLEQSQKPPDKVTAYHSEGQQSNVRKDLHKTFG